MRSVQAGQRGCLPPPCAPSVSARRALRGVRAPAEHARGQRARLLPDGRQIAFNRPAIGTARDVGRDNIYIMAASPRPGIRLLTTFIPNHQSSVGPVAQLAFLKGDALKFSIHHRRAGGGQVGSGKVRTHRGARPCSAFATSSRPTAVLLFAVRMTATSTRPPSRAASGIVTTRGGWSCMSWSAGSHSRAGVGDTCRRRYMLDRESCVRWCA